MFVMHRYARVQEHNKILILLGKGGKDKLFPF